MNPGCDDEKPLGQATAVVRIARRDGRNHDSCLHPCGSPDLEARLRRRAAGVNPRAQAQVAKLKALIAQRPEVAKLTALAAQRPEVAKLTALAAERPEVAAGAAFASGFLLATILRLLAR